MIKPRLIIKIDTGGNQGRRVTLSLATMAIQKVQTEEKMEELVLKGDREGTNKITREKGSRIEQETEENLPLMVNYVFIKFFKI